MVNEFATFADAKRRLDAIIKDCVNSTWFNNDHCYMNKKSAVFYQIEQGRNIYARIYIKKVAS